MAAAVAARVVAARVTVAMAAAARARKGRLLLRVDMIRCRYLPGAALSASNWGKGGLPNGPARAVSAAGLVSAAAAAAVVTGVTAQASQMAAAGMPPAVTARRGLRPAWCP